MEDEHRAKRFRVGDYRAVEVVAIDRNTEAPIEHGGEYKGDDASAKADLVYSRYFFGVWNCKDLLYQSKY